jgi:hypothetical protein
MAIDLMYQIDVGFDEQRGYVLSILDINRSKTAGAAIRKGIKGNSMEQLASRLRHVLIEESNKRRHFPLESEPSKIITPDDFIKGNIQ